MSTTLLFPLRSRLPHHLIGLYALQEDALTIASLLVRRDQEAFQLVDAESEEQIAEVRPRGSRG